MFLQDCHFTKTKDDTALRVVYQETSIWEGVLTTVSDGSSLSMEPSAVVPCLLTQYCGSEILGKTTTDPGLSRATVTTYTRAKSELESTLEIVLGMGTPMVKQAGIECLVWSLKKFLRPSSKLETITCFFFHVA